MGTMSACYQWRNLVGFMTLCLVYSASAAAVNSRAVKECGSKPADVVFVLDASSSIWGPDFKKQLKFVQDVVENFQIGPNKVQTSVLTFADHPSLQFHLDTYSSKSSVLQAIDGIQQTGGDTYTAEALRFMRKTSFSPRHGGRKHVAKIAIVITDGNSFDPAATAREAQKARDQIGLHMFAIGVGSGIKMSELMAISSNPDRQYTFRVSNYGALDTIKDLVASKTCQADVIIPTKAPTRPPAPIEDTTTSPPPTKPSTTSAPTTTTLQPVSTTTERPIGDSAASCGRPTDVMFLVDADSAGPENTQKTISFVKDVVSDLDVGKDRFRVGMIHECADIPGFHLNTYFNKTEMLKAFEKSERNQGYKMPYLIQRMRTRSFRPSQGGRPEIRKVSVIITNQRSGTMSRTIQEAQKARLENNIEIIGIGVGRNVDKTELQAMVSCPEDQRAHIVADFNKLPSLHRNVVRQIRNC